MGDTPAGCRSGNTFFPGCLFSGCNYTGTYVDYNGMPIDDPTNILAKNLMSYGICRQEFTDGQLDLAYTYYYNVRRHQYELDYCGKVDDRVEFEGTTVGIDRVAIDFNQSGVHHKTLVSENGDFDSPMSFSSSFPNPKVTSEVRKLGSEPDFSFTYAEWVDGVSTWDLILIQKHIIGIDKLDGYDQVAADANHSNSVSTFDVVELRKLIQYIYTSLPAYSQPWRFIPEFATLNNPTHFDDNNDDNPFQFNVDGIVQYELKDGKQGFDAVKIGDVNNSNSESDGLIGGSGGGTLISDDPIYVDIIKHVANGVSTYEFRVQDFQDIVAYQMDIEFPEENLQLTGTQSMDLAGVIPDFFGTTHASEGFIKALWYDEVSASAASLANGSGIFKLVFNGVAGQLQGDVHLGENIGFRADGEHKILQNHAYMPDGTIRPIIQREFQNGNIVAVSVHPNPFTSTISLNVEAERESSLELSLHNAVGQCLYRFDSAISKGTNNVSINDLNHLPTGIYLVSLTSGDETIVKKLVKQD